MPPHHLLLSGGAGPGVFAAPPGQLLFRMIPTGSGGVKGRHDKERRTGSFRLGAVIGPSVLRASLATVDLPFDGGVFQQESEEAAQPVPGPGAGLEVDGDRAELGTAPGAGI